VAGRRAALLAAVPGCTAERPAPDLALVTVQALDDSQEELRVVLPAGTGLPRQHLGFSVAVAVGDAERLQTPVTADPALQAQLERLSADTCQRDA
jgi:outer membrane receptor protein involved in Fe transport